MYYNTNTYVKGKFGQVILKTPYIQKPITLKLLVQTISEIHLRRSIIGMFLISFAEDRGVLLRQIK